MEALKALDRELGGPGVDRLYAAARRRGIDVDKAQVAAFARTRSEIEPVAPSQPFNGKTYAAAPNERWQLDTALMPKKGGKKAFLVATDVFTRKSWTTPLRSMLAGTTATAVERLFDKAGAKPKILTSDDGNEFNRLPALAQQNFVYRRKLRNDPNAIAVNDRAMQEIKLNLKKRQLRGEGSWPDTLEAATRAKNQTVNETVHGAPDDADKGGVQQFMIEQDQAKNFAHNHMENRRLTERVLATGWFRPPRDIPKLKRRVAAVRYGPPEPVFGLRAGSLLDPEGKETLLKRALIVPPPPAPPERPPQPRPPPVPLAEPPISTRTRTQLRNATPAPPPAPPPPPPIRRRLRVELV